MYLKRKENAILSNKKEKRDLRIIISLEFIINLALRKFKKSVSTRDFS